MRCSVIIPTLNEASAIEHTLRRVQRLAPHEIIVADGGSLDGTREIAAAHATVVNGRRGRGTQLNNGAARATGDALLFLHADVRLPSDALEAIEKTLSDPDVVGGYFRVRFGRGAFEAFASASYDVLRFRGKAIVYGDSCIFTRREVFGRLEGYREDRPIMEDVNLVHRMRAVGRVVALPKTVMPSTRRWRDGQRLGTYLSWWAVQIMYGLGVSPSWLARFYGHAR